MQREDVVPHIRWRIDLPAGEEMPHGYGIAYYHGVRPGAVVMPLPINLIVGGWRAFKWWLKCPPWRAKPWQYERMEREREFAWWSGYASGQLDERKHPRHRR